MRHFIVLIITSLLLTSCARQITSDVYAAKQVGETSTTYPGIIKHARTVNVEHSENLQDNTLGIAGGGIAGGLLGSSFGDGHFVPKAAGALIGAVTGAFTEKKLKQQTAYEYIVELNDGSLVTIVQGLDQCFSIGQPVYVLQGERSRIIPQ